MAPYGASSRFIHMITGCEIFQKIFAKRYLKLMKAIRVELGLRQPLKELVQRQLECGLLDQWRISKLARMAPEEYEKWIKIENIELLKNEIEKGSGVLIANTHTCMSRFVPVLLAREGINVTCLEADDYYAKLKLPGLELNSSISIRGDKGFYLKALMNAKKVLKSGGVLVMAPDGLQGMASGHTTSFLGRKRPFYTTFAALAEQTSSPVIMGIFSLDSNGILNINFKKCESDNHSETSSQLIISYVKHLESIWLQDIGAVQSRHLVNYLKCES